MSDCDKTLIVEPGSRNPEYGNCPVCDQKLQPDWDDVELLRCPACSYTKKTVTVIEPGSVVAHKYRILNLLNGGGYGSIFLCYHLSDPTIRYVLKILSHPTATARKRFRREENILASISKNPRTARIMDFWEVGDDTYIVMEYVKGHNLRELTSSCRLDEVNVLTIAYEVSRALQDIWNGFAIIHRDIKPENIMIDQNSMVKLLDFGLSKQCGSEQNTAAITMASSSLGTPGYMSPEHFTDFKNADFRSDIYSLGATLFFLLTGHQPGRGRDMVEHYEQTIANSPPSAEAFNGSCSPGCISMIRKMMQRMPEDRHSSYEELISEINTLLG